MSESGAPDVDAALLYAAERVGGTVSGPRRYGWQHKSAGSTLTLRDGSTWWLRVQHFNPRGVHGHRWTGEIAAGHLDGILKPRLREHFQWLQNELAWRALVMTKASATAVSETPTLHSHPDLTPKWFAQLRQSLRRLAAQPTDRVYCGQKYFAALIHRVFGTGLDTTASRWMVCHGDLQWANVGWPEPVLFDWETWGGAPFGFDAARLYVYSGCVPDVARQVAAAFSDVLDTRDGRLSILYTCAEVVEMISQVGHPSPDLLPSVEAVARDTLERLRLE
jgi:hypothetical protein